MTENIKNKVVIITGASSGLGEATALLLAKYGAKVVLAARRKERLEMWSVSPKRHSRRMVVLMY